MHGLFPGLFRQEIRDSGATLPAGQRAASHNRGKPMRLGLTTSVSPVLDAEVAVGLETWKQLRCGDIFQARYARDPHLLLGTLGFC